ncbi:MAG: hypothetical protein K6E28_09935 [Eubacterium sp.]|nr:hypothetical protein [Eubacterium sp.]
MKELLKRIVAMMLVLIFAVLLGLFFYCIIFKTEWIVPMLFVLIIYPVVLYVAMWLRKVFSTRADVENYKKMKASEQESGEKASDENMSSGDENIDS